jgi:hypothetical protein
MTTKKDKLGGELRPEYDIRRLGPGVRGKYYQRAKAGTNLVLIEPEIAEVFPDSASVNDALRGLAAAARPRAKNGRSRGSRRVARKARTVQG